MRIRENQDLQRNRMRTAVIQLRPHTGNIERNIVAHEQALRQLSTLRVDLVVFSELSLTGYEPSLAHDLALDSDDERLTVFQKLSNRFDMIIGVGAPIRKQQKIHIGLIFFRPSLSRLIYFKKYLHPDELPFFSAGDNVPILEIKQSRVAPAICYEVSCEEHRSAAVAQHPTLYVASVAKFERGILDALQTLGGFSREHQMPVMVCNSIGPADNGLCCGLSSAWDRSGIQVAQLGREDEGVIVYDSETDSATVYGLRDEIA